MKKKFKKNNNINQASFYFEDYLETNKKNKILKKSNNFQDRIYLLFFFFLSLILIFSIKITHISINKKDIFNLKKQNYQFSLLRRDIVDRNNIIISRNINTFHAAVDPKHIKDKKNFLIKLRLNFPDLPIDEIKEKINQKKYFRIKKRINRIEKDKFWALGEKAIKFEPFQARMYTHGNLFSHIIGQVDYDNYGISGVEKYFDRELKNKNLLEKPLKLSLDSNIQYIINNELEDAIKTFKATGAGALLMDVNNGDIISLVSLPNYDINQRVSIKNDKYINKITKGVYELGSIFKTFTIALALEHKLVETKTIIKDIPKKIRCSVHEIKDMKEHPSNLSVENILIRSSNLGSVILAKKIGEQNYKDFIKKTKITENPNIELEEIGAPHRLSWNSCKLETVSFGHGITTTPLQATSLYAAMVNGGKLVTPSIIQDRPVKKIEKIISKETSDQLRKILRKVVSSEEGTASLADKDGYYVGGKTGTAESYGNKKNRINTFISIFPSNKPNYTLFIMLENPKINKDLTYDYRGTKTTAPYNTSGWNSVYVAGKIIEKIGPILAINSEEFVYQNVVEKFN
ncbi:penicillin-binding protein 2 [Pelagibacteraceae bacterium]|nr:penicillin-binding protein 2 [Pelagibacteraceae bacterium]